VTDTTLFHCECGKVAFEITGRPIIAAACYCDDCQAGGRQLEALGVGPVLDPDGATPYLLYRRDRVRRVSGSEFLKPQKLRDGSITSRMVAGCCNTAMLVSFDRTLHWVSVYRRRLGAGAPPLAVRVQTKFAPGAVADDLPRYPAYPLSFVGKLVAARIAMLLGR
jgi:hypothetical protein